MAMTPEEKERADRVDRQLEFLAAHQAQLSSDIAELQRVTAEHSKQFARLGEMIEKQGEQIKEQGKQIREQGEQIASQGEQIGALGIHSQSLAETVLRLGQVMAERDRQTDARINALILVVERYFSNGKK